MHQLHQLPSLSHPPPLRPMDKALRKRSTLPHTTRENHTQQGMSLMSTSSFHRKTSRPVIQFNGGMRAGNSFLISIASPVIFSQSLVRISLHVLCLEHDPDFFWVISGSAVAVERIFSGGRDTISLRRASLKAETISKLMIIKHRLRLAREEAEKLAKGR